jgi:hypothetical protein
MPAPLFVRYSQEGRWHIVQSNEPLPTDRRGDVYLAKCWRWIGVDDAARHGSLAGGPRSNEDVCQSCLGAPLTPDSLVAGRVSEPR